MAEIAGFLNHFSASTVCRLWFFDSFRENADAFFIDLAFSFGADNKKAVHPEGTDNDNLFRHLRFRFSFWTAFDRLKVWVVPLQAVFRTLSSKRFRSMDIFCGHKALPSACQ